jgi:4-alpha-glucanotransferase
VGIVEKDRHLPPNHFLPHIISDKAMQNLKNPCSEGIVVSNQPHNLPTIQQFFQQHKTQHRKKLTQLKNLRSARDEWRMPLEGRVRWFHLRPHAIARQTWEIIDSTSKVRAIEQHRSVHVRVTSQYIWELTSKACSEATNLPPTLPNHRQRHQRHTTSIKV